MKAARTQNSSAPMLKQEFLNKWINGLQIYTTLKNQMTISERKNAIKLSADVAIASTRDNISANWSRALMANVVSQNADGASKIVVERLSGQRIFQNNNNNNIKASTMIACGRRIMRRSRLARRKRAAAVGTSAKARWIAKRLVKKRTRVLKRLVPGGDEMDGIGLIEETLDYIASLQVQVDVMRKIAAVAERLEPPERSF